MIKLKKFRVENRYKLKDIAEVTGVSIQAVHQWEIGETMPPIDKLIKIARFFGCTIDELIGEDDDEGRAESEA